MRKIIFFIIVLIAVTACNTSKSITNKAANNTIATSPKLVVGIVVDQMRYDYLTRFYNKYSEGGFKRLINNGYNCKNAHFNYVPTFTGPGHASVYTGTTPKNHGIIANNWYDRVEGKKVYCVNDNNFKGVGTQDPYSKVSPNRLLVTAITDQLKLHTQQQSKVIGIAIKDRGAVLPAGHSGNAAYWFQGKDEGNWVSSTYYMNVLPNWVKAFNSSRQVDNYLKIWNTYYPIETYTESGTDLNAYEKSYKGKETPTFPYDLKELATHNKNYDILKATAYGNNLTTDFAIAAIKGEQLGTRNHTDFLAISYSSTDYVGHNFGVNSVEIEDTYIRLDKDIERLLNTLDNTVGKDNYTIFLTADHAAVHVPNYLKDVKIPGGYYNLKAFKEQLNSFLTKRYGASDLLENASNFQIFLNREKIALLNLDLYQVQDAVVNEIINYKHIDKAYPAYAMSNQSFNEGIETLLQNGYHQKRSGDILVTLQPNVIEYPKTGSTHGSGLNYDTHVPMLFYGKGINNGTTYNKVYITDIAPTLSAMLGIAFPNGATGAILNEVIE